MSTGPGQPTNVLLVKNLPGILSDHTLQVLFQHYGASEVVARGDEKRSSRRAFVTFASSKAAGLSFPKINRLQLLNKTLAVEYAHPKAWAAESEDALMDSRTGTAKPCPRPSSRSPSSASSNSTLSSVRPATSAGTTFRSWYTATSTTGRRARGSQCGATVSTATHPRDGASTTQSGSPSR
ncbi:hypothetical protein CYMTET_54698 [Cymbomonas tetramitiformis]|uniref:RRM domain-containing protein n=1 Tax=Cymbomonas tetramitiformis TaxID=36881 RepID=A0AAE0BFL9_9CHLO|nr:hypothetical protein CYMTET_54698 [Cymbomonas tetramitiformis]